MKIGSGIIYKIEIIFSKNFPFPNLKNKCDLLKARGEAKSNFKRPWKCLIQVKLPKRKNPNFTSLHFLTKEDSKNFHWIKCFFIHRLVVVSKITLCD